MKQDEIIEMARQAGFTWEEDWLLCLDDKMKPKPEYKSLETFAKLVAAKEREACAKTCEELTFSKAGPSHDALRQRLLCAEAIRTRGEA